MGGILPNQNEHSLTYVESRFSQLSSQYLKIKESCEKTVVSWRWATNELYDPRPFWFERNGYKLGRYLKNLPKKQNYKFEYGLDDRGAIIIERQHIRFDGYPERIWCYETFYIRSDNLIEVAYYDYHPDKTPISFSRRIGSEQQFELWESRKKNGIVRENYSWQQDKLFGIGFEYAPVNEHGDHGPLVFNNRFEIKYDQKGELEEILSHWPRRTNPEVAYNISWLEVPLERLLRDARNALVASINENICLLKLSDPVFSLIMAWNPEEDAILPPFIGIGLEREREQWIQEHGKDANLFMWNPAEYKIHFNIRSDALMDVCTPLNERCARKGSWSAVAKLLNDIAKEFNNKDWTGMLTTTNDFVSVATNYELTDFRGNLKVSARDSLVLDFSNKGWLP